MRSVEASKLKHIVGAITTVKADEPDGLFICSSSFEERCRVVPRILESSGYRTLASIIFNYSGTKKQGLRQYNRAKIVDFLSSVSLHLPAFEINCDRNEPLDGMEKLESALRTLGSKQETPVTIDISTFTKQYLLTLLRRIESLLHPDSVRLLYTEPGIYGKGEFKRLTYGVKDVVVVPEFIGEEKEGKLLLVVFLGYEAHRTLAVIEKYEPDLLIAVVGKPPYYERWDDFSVKAHRFLLSRPEVVRWEMPTRDPDGVRNGLERISEKFCDEFTNMYVSPSGTKLQTVGIYEFARVHPNARIVYAIPGEYLESYYTVGSGETWAYYLR